MASRVRRFGRLTSPQPPGAPWEPGPGSTDPRSTSLVLHINSSVDPDCLRMHSQAVSVSPKAKATDNNQICCLVGEKRGSTYLKNKNRNINFEETTTLLWSFSKTSLKRLDLLPLQWISAQGLQMQLGPFFISERTLLFSRRCCGPLLTRKKAFSIRLSKLEAERILRRSLA